MTCILCGKKEVITLQQGPLCRDCFIRNFQKKVYRNIRKFRLFTKSDILCFAISGGKDSMSMLYVVKDIARQQRQKFFALTIDEGEKGCLKRVNHVNDFCKKHGIDLVTLSLKDELGRTCSQFMSEARKKKLDIDCTALCDALRRRLITKYAKKFKSTRIVLGTNLDDEARAFILNIFSKGKRLTSGLGPSVVMDGIMSIKPLYMCSSEETALYAGYMKLGMTCDCLCSKSSNDAFIDKKLEELESLYKGTKTAVIQNILNLLPALKNTPDNNDADKALKKLGIRI